MFFAKLNRYIDKKYGKEWKNEVNDIVIEKIARVDPQQQPPEVEENRKHSRFISLLVVLFVLTFCAGSLFAQLFLLQ